MTRFTLTRPADELMQDMAREDPAYRREVIAGAAHVLLGGEPEVARLLLRDLVIGAYGYDLMAERAELPRGRVVHALRRTGPVAFETLVRLITAAQKIEGVEFDIRPILQADAAE